MPVQTFVFGCGGLCPGRLSLLSGEVSSRPYILTPSKLGFAWHLLRQVSESSTAAREQPSSHTLAFGTTEEGKGKHLLGRR
jgi:arginyl-tRNA synthetase